MITSYCFLTGIFLNDCLRPTVTASTTVKKEVDDTIPTTSKLVILPPTDKDRDFNAMNHSNQYDYENIEGIMYSIILSFL